MPKFNLEENAGEAILPEYFDHPTEGWLSYDPNTLAINRNRDGHKPINQPIVLTGKFFGTKQPDVPTCSEPSPGNAGCAKWYGCPMKKFPHVGPGAVIMRKHGTVSFANCYDFFETTRGNRPISQMHYGLEGWKLDTSRTTIDVLGRTRDITNGKLNAESSHAAVMASRPSVWQLEIADLLPPWWPLQKKKGLKLHPSSQYYPELAEDDEPVKKKRGRPKKAVE